MHNKIYEVIKIPFCYDYYNSLLCHLKYVIITNDDIITTFQLYNIFNGICISLGKSTKSSWKFFIWNYHNNKAIFWWETTVSWLVSFKFLTSKAKHAKNILYHATATATSATTWYKKSTKQFSREKWWSNQNSMEMLIFFGIDNVPCMMITIAAEKFQKLSGVDRSVSLWPSFFGYDCCDVTIKNMI